ncbi:hypothetical protein ASC97_29620 [Rhizobium sp. Root1203]|nr:hypothetical protein ASC97_29620 [Rhizobium sp. Root1203]
MPVTDLHALPQGTGVHAAASVSKIARLVGLFRFAQILTFATLRSFLKAFEDSRRKTLSQKLEWLSQRRLWGAAVAALLAE